MLYQTIYRYGWNKRVRSKIRTARSFPQWKLRRNGEQNSKENLY